MAVHASYLPTGELPQPADLVPELSRRARGFSTWAMLKSRGRQGIAQLVGRHCALAARMAERLRAGGGAQLRILNDVALNQVAVRLGEHLGSSQAADALTERVITRIQRAGVCFVGGAHWRDMQILRISVIGGTTTEADIDTSADAILQALHDELASSSNSSSK